MTANKLSQERRGKEGTKDGIGIQARDVGRQTHLAVRDAGGAREDGGGHAHGAHPPSAQAVYAKDHARSRPLFWAASHAGIYLAARRLHAGRGGAGTRRVGGLGCGVDQAAAKGGPACQEDRREGFARQAAVGHP